MKEMGKGNKTIQKAFSGFLLRFHNVSAAPDCVATDHTRQWLVPNWVDGFFFCARRSSHQNQHGPLLSAPSLLSPHLSSLHAVPQSRATILPFTVTIESSKKKKKKKTPGRHRGKKRKKRGEILNHHSF